MDKHEVAKDKEAPIAKAAKAPAAYFCPFCKASARPTLDGVHKCQCRMEPVNPKPGHWSTDPEKVKQVLAGVAVS